MILKLTGQIVLTSLIAALAIAGVAYATTIGTNISTEGTLAVSLSSTMATTTISSGDLIVDTDTLIVDNDNSRVGVGTTTPAYLLDVDGDLRVGVVGTASTLYVGTTAGRVGVGTTTPFATFSIDTNAGDNAFVIGSSSATYLIVDTGGKVGIGSSTPTAKLSVGDATSVSGATSTIDFAKPCFRFMTDNGTVVYYWPSLSTGNATRTGWATSTTSCF